jgi:hypothetical protein
LGAGLYSQADQIPTLASLNSGFIAPNENSSQILTKPFPENKKLLKCLLINDTELAISNGRQATIEIRLDLQDLLEPIGIGRQLP